MRIYEFAKKHKIPAKEVVQLLQHQGFKVKTHMSALDEKAINFLDRHLKGKDEQPVKKVVAKNEAETEVSRIKKEPARGAKKVVSAIGQQEKKKIAFVEESPKELLAESMSLAGFAHHTGKPINELIVTLLKMGIVATKNQILPEEVVLRLAGHFELPVVKPKVDKSVLLKEIEVKKGKFQARPPVVVVLGHVDHGKTTLLDFVRKTRVAAREKGGITQHLGAYEVQTKQGNLIFLDTPGHEAFYKIRGRGAGVADIAILIIAADDGVMPQTIEAIKHAKAADIPIIVAINKADKVDAARVTTVMQSLAQYDLLPEEWGGEVIVAPISAKFGTGVDHLLEMVILRSELMELTADVAGPVQGHVLESKPEKGLGPVGTVLCQHGSLRVGEFFVCGQTGGKVSSLIDSSGRRVREVGPSVPVQVAGFDALPEVGDLFEVVPEAEYRQAKAGTVGRKPVQRPLVEGALNILLKADTNSSKEALLGAITKLSGRLEKAFNVIHAGVGDVSESDIMLASNTNSLIYSFHVKVEQNAHLLAQRLGVAIGAYDIIYKLLENLEELAEKGKEVKKVLTKTGEAVVRKVFQIEGVGTIAGCYVRDGSISRKGKLVVWRGKQKIGSGPIASLQRERKSVKEVHTGFECGFMIDGFTDWQVDDRVECFLEVPEKPR